MKIAMIAALLLFPLSAAADHMDVLQVKLKDGCTVAKYVSIKNDFNEQWGKNNGKSLAPRGQRLFADASSAAAT